MRKDHFNNSIIFYAGLFLAFIICFGAIYQNLYIEKNFRQFTVNDPEPAASDLYLHPNTVNLLGI
jgi:hypothetical protein